MSVTPPQYRKPKLDSLGSVALLTKAGTAATGEMGMNPDMT